MQLGAGSVGSDTPSSLDEVLELERRAITTPDAPALLAPGRAPLSYAALWHRVLSVRAKLLKVEIVTGQLMVLVLPDGPDFIITLLAAAGLGPCAPLDPAHSSNEYESLLAQLRAPVLVTMEGICPAALLSARHLGIKTVQLRYGKDYELHSVSGTLGHERSWEPRSVNASLVMFTSATTGRPKLVPVTLASHAEACRNEARALGLTPSDRLLNLIPLFTQRGLRGALTQLFLGASVVCPPRFDPNHLPDLLDEFQPSWLSLASAALSFLCSQARQMPDLWRGRSVRFIRTGSAAPEPELLREMETRTGVPVLDGYGTTESGGVTRSTIRFRRPGSVGRSTGTEIAILDETGLAPPGKPGEIVLRGASVMAGYLDEGEANCQAFADGWLRTGDLGYLDADGYLFLTGRLKEMINRGGQKILPQQVELVLKAHPGVEDAAVFAVAHRTLGEEVAAAVVVRGQSVSEWELRRFAASQLAPYKVPHRIVFMDRLPRGATGKLLRGTLSDKVAELDLQERQKTPSPCTATEKLLATIWEDAFQRGPVSREADFSALGGDSLMAAYLAARIHDTFGVELDLSAFTDHSRLCDLASVVEMLAGQDRPGALARAPRGVPIPLSFSQDRTWKYTWTTPRSADGACSLSYNMAFSHVLRGQLEIETLRQSLNAIAQRHEILRTRFEEADGAPVQSVHASEGLELPLLDLSQLPEPRKQASLLLEEEARKPFHLARGPLLRLVLVRIAADEHWLLRVNHHIISDAASWSLFLHEWAIAYRDLLGGRRPGLPGLKQDYGDYAWWQRRELSLTRPAIRQALDWWTKQHHRPGRPPMLPFYESINALAAVGREAANVTPSQGILWWGLRPDLTVRLDDFGRTEGATYFVTRLAAYAALIADLTGRFEVILGSYFSYRKRLEWQSVMGDFTNLVTLILECDRSLSFRDWVRVVRNRVTETRACGEVPYEAIREELRARGINPQPIGVMFHAADHTAPKQFGAAEMTWLSRAVPAMPWGFTLTVDRHNEDRLCNVTFDARLYDPEAVRLYLSRYIRLLEVASRQPDMTLFQLFSKSKTATASAAGAS